MRKLKIAALVIFCGGILLTGIGVGVSMIEYSSLEYSGRHILEEGSRDTITKKMPVQMQEGKEILIRSYADEPEIFYDEKMPENEIQFELTYNQELLNVRVEESGSSEESCSQEILIIDEYKAGCGNDFEIWMRNKDQILSELRKGKIGSWDWDWDIDVKITIPSSLKDFVKIAD